MYLNLESYRSGLCVTISFEEYVEKKIKAYNIIGMWAIDEVVLKTWLQQPLNLDSAQLTGSHKGAQ